MFIETLEFTIPVDLCDLFSTMKRGPQSNLEFPASVNSYGTTQDANVQVCLKANKLTFKVDGVSSDASMISKSECRTLKLSVFDVDRSLMPFDENDDYQSNNISTMQQPPQSAPLKRVHEQSISVPPAKNSRTSFPESSKARSPPPPPHRHPQSRASPRPENSQPKQQNHTPVNVKEEPEDPDLIEIEPDPEDVVPKTETPYMQIDYSSTGPCTQTSQAALDRLSFPPTSHSRSHSQSSPSSSSFHQNVPHVPDYAEPGPSQQSRHSDQSADDYLVFQGEEGDDNEADYSNDVWTHRSWTNRSISNDDIQNSYPVSRSSGEDAKIPPLTPCVYWDCSVVMLNVHSLREHIATAHAGADSLECPTCHRRFLQTDNLTEHIQICQKVLPPRRTTQCEECGKWFASNQKKKMHVSAQHRGIMHTCECGQVYSYSTGLDRHRKSSGHTPQSELPVGSLSVENKSSDNSHLQLGD